MTIVLHDQSEPIEDSIRSYEGSLASKGLPDIPFHASPLMYGKDAYASLDHEKTATNVKIFGPAKAFRRNYLRLLRRNSLC